jgi:hypothetical protein
MCLPFRERHLLAAVALLALPALIPMQAPARCPVRQQQVFLPMAI